MDGNQTTIQNVLFFNQWIDQKISIIFSNKFYMIKDIFEQSSLQLAATITVKEYINVNLHKTNM
jgi:hypothetical protein